MKHAIATSNVPLAGRGCLRSRWFYRCPMTAICSWHPVPELEALRGEHVHFSDLQLNGDTAPPLDEVSGDQTGDSSGV